MLKYWNESWCLHTGLKPTFLKFRLKTPDWLPDLHISKNCLYLLQQLKQQVMWYLQLRWIISKEPRNCQNRSMRWLSSDESILCVTTPSSHYTDLPGYASANGEERFLHLPHTKVINYQIDCIACLQIDSMTCLVRCSTSLFLLSFPPFPQPFAFVTIREQWQKKRNPGCIFVFCPCHLFNPASKQGMQQNCFFGNLLVPSRNSGILILYI